MWKKTRALVLLALVSLMLAGCYSHRRAYGYRDGYAPGYVQVRVGTRHSHGPSYRVRHYDRHPNAGRHYRNFKHKHYRGCGHNGW